MGAEPEHYEVIVKLLSWGRANGIVVLIGAETFESVPAILIQNTALHLCTEDTGSLVDLDGHEWSLVGD